MRLGDMQPGELVVARLAKGAKVVRYLGGSAAKAELALGRNKIAKLPTDRILLATGIRNLKDDQLEEFARECTKQSLKIDLSGVWDIVKGESTSWTIYDLADMYWGDEITDTNIVAFLLKLEDEKDHFVSGNKGYIPRTPAEVSATSARRRREAEEAQAASSFISTLDRGVLPETLSENQTSVLEDLRGYAIHGEEYVRSSAVTDHLGIDQPPGSDLHKRAFDLLVSAGVFSLDEHLELHRSGMTEGFPDRVCSESALIDLSVILEDSQRRDLTSLQTLTIDDCDTEDRDDALSFEWMGRPWNSGYRVWVHIADAGAIIPRGSVIDEEADKRMATLYLPDGSVGLLPRRISRDLGSLDEGSERAALSILVEFTPECDIARWEVIRSVIRSDDALTYEDADLALVNGRHRLQPMLSSLQWASGELRHRREESGGINLERSEMTVRVMEGIHIDVKVAKRSGPSRELVEDLMVLCNSILASFALNEGLPVLYRSQPTADLSDLLPDNSVCDDTVTEIFRRYSVIKRLPSAQVGVVPNPHAGLGVSAYLQSTSPLRRYPDLILQRQISCYCVDGGTIYSAQELESLGQRAEMQLREIAHLEEGRKRYWFLKHLMLTRLEGDGECELDMFDAVVLENDFQRRGLVELMEFPFRARVELPLKVTPGDKVSVRLQSIDLWRRAIQFGYIG